MITCLVFLSFGNLAFLISKQICHGSSSKPTPTNKKRIRWTQDLHEQFVKCVNSLGGAESK